jgi:glucosamine 6-phosphate synthetase-like amidotransferase/phosphosugar isomerase protein
MRTTKSEFRSCVSLIFIFSFLHSFLFITMAAFLLTQRSVVGAFSLKRGCLSLTQSFVRRQASSSSTIAVPVAAQHHDAHSSSSTMSRMAPWLAAGAVLTAGAALNLEQGNCRTQAEPLRPVNNKILSSDDYTNLCRTLQEVNEQPEAIARALNFGECMGYEKVVVNDLDQNEDKVNKISHLTLSAQGTSLNAARYGERLMKELGAFTSVASVDSANMQTSDFPCFDVDSTGLIVVSDCEGAKKDVSDAVASAMEKGVTVMNVVNTLGSLLASTDNEVGDDVFGTDDSDDSEYTMTSTKVFTTQVAVLALISLWFKESRDRELGNGPSSEALELKEALMRLPIMFGMTLQKREQCREIAKRLQDKDRCFVIGKGMSLYCMML